MSLSNTIPTCLPLEIAIRAMPMHAPRLSKSEYWWPITRTLSTLDSSSLKELATTLALTFVRFSTPLDTPPKNSKPERVFITAWSPPRLRAMSSAASADSSLPAGVSLSIPIPIDMVGKAVAEILSALTLSSMSKRLSINSDKSALRHMSR